MMENMTSDDEEHDDIRMKNMTLSVKKPFCDESEKVYTDQSSSGMSENMCQSFFIEMCQQRSSSLMNQLLTPSEKVYTDQSSPGMLENTSELDRRN